MHFAVFISGFTAVVGQALLIREGLTLFSGNELSSGIVIWLWLIWTGIGSLLFPRLKLKKEPLKIYAFLLFLLAIMFIYSFLFFRFIPQIFSLPSGEVIGLDRMVLFSFIALGPACLLVGALFPAASIIIAPSTVYLIEGIGSFAGGILFSFLLIMFLPPSGILLIVVSLLLSAGFYILNRKKFIFIAVIPLILLLKIQHLEFFLRKIQMPKHNLIALYESRYGTIAVTKSETQLNFYSSGFFDFAYPDVYSAEDAVHYPLLIHLQPEKILLIGGGAGGGIVEALKHPSIKSLTYVELDPKLLEVSRQYLGNYINDERVRVIIGDGRFFVKNTKDNFDCIIVNLPDPLNAQLNRYYTKEFFQEARRHLKTDGLFSIRATSPPDMMSPLYAQYLGTIYATLKQVFKNVYILPTARITFIATDLTIASKITELFKKRLALRNLELVYVNEYFFDYNFTPEKIEFLKSTILRSGSYINTDLKPVCYYFNTILWGGVISHGLKKLFVKLFNLNPFFFFLLLLLLLFFWRQKTIVYASIFSIGAGEISAEIILIILLQVLYGYIYAWIGLIIGLFMLGLAMGTYLFIRTKFFHKHSIDFLTSIHIFITIYFALILGTALLKISDANYLIAILISLGGLLGGLHFPLS
ncbi:MAG: methyltransferase, partial [candidate division WOR-3 bacterium]